MGRLMSWIGAEPLEFGMATKCCGGMLMTTQPAVGVELVSQILGEAKKIGADCIATACPMCQINLEAHQKKAGKKLNAECNIPVLYFTQLMGIAMGLEPAQLALADNLTSPNPVLAARSQ